MGIFNLFKRQKPKINPQTEKKSGFDGWVKCSGCQELIHSSQLEENHQCCPKCSFHFRLSARERIELLADEGSFEEMFANLKPQNPLAFVDTESYDDRLSRAKKKSKESDAVIVGSCTIEGEQAMLGVLNFAFMGGSMGSVVGERITRMIEHATKNRLPVIMVCSSGGARMQESIFSLMQMAKTSAALARHGDEGLAYITVLTNPTTGGVTASFASLGDVIIAEPGALIGFAGPRVIEQTMRQKLPESAQKSEFLIEKGMIDCISHRSELKNTLSFFIDMFAPGKPSPAQEFDQDVQVSSRTRAKNKIEIVSTK